MAHGRVGQPPYYVALRLFNVAAEHWAQFNGECVSLGVNIRKLPCPDFFDLIYFWLVRNADQKEKDKIDLQLFLPPIGMEAEADHPFFSEEAEMSAFEGLDSAMGGKRPTR